MKRVWSMFLCICMLLSFALLAGCAQEKTAADSGTDGQTATTGSDGTLTTAELEASLPCEYIQEKLDAGMEVLVGHSNTTFDNATANYNNNELEKRFTELGCSYLGVACENDTATQITQIENFITMKTACLYVASGDANAIKDVLLEAEAAGTRVVFYGGVPEYEVSATVCVDLDNMGYQCGMMARAWLDQRYPDAEAGSIEVAAYGFYYVTECGMISDGMKRAISEDSRCTIVYTHDDCTGIDAGFTATEEALTAHPDLKLIVSYDMDAAIGASNYITSMPNVDMQDYGVFTTNTNSEIFQLLEDAENGSGCLRGTITGNEDTVASSWQCMYELMFNPDVEIPLNVWEDLNALNCVGFTAQNN